MIIFEQFENSLSSYLKRLTQALLVDIQKPITEHNTKL